MRSDHRRSCLLALLLTGLVAISSSCSREQSAPAPAAGSPLRPGDIAFPGMQMRPAANASSFILIGRVKNRSSLATLTEVQLRMTMEDVLASGATTTVAETTVAIRREVPPAQSVEFEEKVEFGKLPKPKGRHEWNYAVVSVKSR